MNVNRERKMIPVEVTQFNIDGETIKQIIARLQDMALSYGEDAVINKENEPYSDGTYLGVFVKRPETDEVMTARIAQEEYWAKRHADSRRAQYEALKREFGE